MSYQKVVFRIGSTTTTTVVEDLEQANENFTILEELLNRDAKTLSGVTLDNLIQICRTKVGLDADLLDGYHAGNSNGQIPINNGTLNNTLNADMVDGFHASQTSKPNSIVVSDINGKILLTWIPFTGLNADLLDSYHAGNNSGQIPISNGMLNSNLNADMVDGYHVGNNPSQIPISNGTVNSNLNADMVDGFHASQTSKPNSIITSDSNGKIDISWLPSTMTVSDADKVDGFHASVENNSNNIVVRDSNKKIHVDYVVGNLLGNASTATKLETARTITLSGAVTGSANFDGTSNITINTSMSEDGVTKYYTETTIPAGGQFQVARNTITNNTSKNFSRSIISYHISSSNSWIVDQSNINIRYTTDNLTCTFENVTQENLLVRINIILL